ncbi:MAG TPA: hypothetical protein PKH77_27680 [Anaerolineae bacterium]|nr:hypothetical protein [Anaerolineae bacterium]
MAEEVTSQNVSPETPQSSGQSQPTNVPASAQPQQTQESKPVNLQEFEEFRKYQSAKDREIRQLRDQSQQQIAAMQAQLEALQTRDMPDEQRAHYEVQKRDRYIQQLQQEMQAVRAEQARVAALSEISRETGAPLDVLMDADNPDDAWRKGFRWAKGNLTQAQQRQVAEAAEEHRANTVDIGRGRVHSTSDDLKAEYREALENNDGAALYAIRIRATREGIEL